MEQFEQIVVPEYVLFINYDGGQYRLMAENSAVYNVGEMICELDRVELMRIKPLILENSFFHEPLRDKILSKATLEMKPKMEELYGICSTSMILSQMTLRIRECIKFGMDSFSEIMKKRLEIDKDRIREIMDGTEYDDLGGECVGQFLLSLLAMVDVDFGNFDYYFKEIVEDRKQSIAELLMTSYGRNLFESQNYEYNIMWLDGKLRNMYGIKDFMSLLLFEFANCTNNGVGIRKCENCGNYFVVTGRADAIYCSYVAPGYKNKTCREVGPQKKRAAKEKNDEPTKEYRKVYMRLVMQYKRHPDDEVTLERLNKLKSEAMTMRNNMAHGKISIKEYYEWLKQFE